LRPFSRSFSRRRRKDVIAAVLFVAPGFALFALVILYRSRALSRISLYHWAIAPGTPSAFIGLRATTRRHCTIRSSGGASSRWLLHGDDRVPAIVIGLAIAVLLDAHIRRGRFFRTLFYRPVVTSWVVVSLAFPYLFITDGGLFNLVSCTTQRMSPVHNNIDWLGQRWTAMIAISILGVWKGVGWSMIIFLPRCKGVPRN